MSTSNSSRTTPAPQKTSRWLHPSPATLLIIGALLTLIGIGVESPLALAVVLMEGTVAFAVIASAAMAGMWLINLFGIASISLPQRVIFGSALGVGSLPLLILIIGSAGVLNRPLAIGLVLALAVIGCSQLALTFRKKPQSPVPSSQFPHPLNWLWLLIVPFLMLAFLAASLPPGVLWQEEGFGYDVLEYHLAVPKIFYEQEKISFLPGNVYSNFPLNSEMLSLLMMVLRNDAIEAAYMATMSNIGLAALFVAAAWLAGRCFSPVSAIIAGVLAGTSGWLTYLSGIAFVEPGMLAMGMAALAAMLHARQDSQNRFRWILLSGALAGLACGFKYTAVPMIALPLIIYPLSSGIWANRLKNAAFYSLAALATFSPWLIRNTINTHNPVFPMAYSIFGAKPGVWENDQQARWHAAHSAAGGERTATPVYIRAWQRSFGEPRMGFALFVLALFGISTSTLFLIAIWLWQFAFWLLGTHLFARFAVVMLLPLVILAGRFFQPQHRRKWIRPAALGLLIAGIFCNLYHITNLYYHHTRVEGMPINAFGRTDWFAGGQWPGTQHWAAINDLPAGSKAMLVGEARTFYIRTAHEYATVFDRHPLSAVARERSEADVLEWLRERGVTHLLVHWNEIDRLSATYGFDALLNGPFFERLQNEGLKIAKSFRLQEGAPPYATLYEVPAHE